jgi:phage terminase large subunit
MVALQLRAAAELELRRRGLKSSDPSSRAAKLAEGLTDWAKPLLQPYRYKCLFGGRGAGKSVAIADCLLVIGLARKIRVLCAREFQISIKESVHALLKTRIEQLGLSDFYQVQETTITGRNGSGFIFKGIRHNIQSIKSMSGLTHCWIEEAQTISAESWRVLIPTIREEGAEVWTSFNPNQETDTVYQQLVANPRANSYVRKVNWDENPHFPDVLNEERLAMQASDPDAYHHIWEGGFWSKSNAQVLSGKWIVNEFEPGEDWDGPYFGADFGFANDPTTLVKCWVYDHRLYVEYESYAHNLDLDTTADRWRFDIPGCDQHAIYADSARPESISYLSRRGLPKIQSVKKWAGSVEDGIAHLRSYDKIVIHPRCPETIREARLYCYKVDKLSGEIMPMVVDAFNHTQDCLRYSMTPILLQKLTKHHGGAASVRQVRVSKRG